MTNAIKHIVQVFLLAKTTTLLSTPLRLPLPTIMAVAALLAFALGVHKTCMLSTSLELPLPEAVREKVAALKEALLAFEIGVLIPVLELIDYLINLLK